MRFVADLHIHSRYARATSRDLNPENLYKWASLKGITVVGTGDFTHPAWFAELQEKLEPAETGLYRLKAPLRAAVDRTLPESCHQDIRFLLSVEISSIYKRHGRTRKVHNLVLLPDFDHAAEFNRRLGAIGNLKSDGRPILGLDSHDLLDLALHVTPDVLFIPAHIWTPHFAVLGSESGFDSLEECFDDLLPHIFALETGLSSDPPMNSRLSALDRYAIVSNSDAHSPQKLAREATCFETELSYPAMYAALQTVDRSRFTGTLEFYPEEGKYHYDGHRKCHIRWKPEETLQAGGRCPQCGGKLTIGVLHQVERLADRGEASPAPVERPFEYLIPLPELIGAALGVGSDTKKTTAIYHKLLAQFGPELGILRYITPEEVARSGEPLVAEALQRMRHGAVVIQAGYDGEYGTITVFDDAERAQLKGQSALFTLAPTTAPVAPRPVVASAATQPALDDRPAVPAVPDELDAMQRQAVTATRGPVLVLAGPGSGKTRTLTQRIVYLIQEQQVAAGQMLAVTFTRRAANEMAERLRVSLATPQLQGLRIGTFHRLALDLLQQDGASPCPTVLDAWEARGLLASALQEAGIKRHAATVQRDIALHKAAGRRPQELSEDEPLRAVYMAYQAQLHTYNAWDYDDILLECCAWLESQPEALQQLRQQLLYVLVDEFQDVNAVQYRLVKLLAGEGHGLFVIGDPDQAIYRFRGAEPRYFQVLQDDFPATQCFQLSSNYRSTRTIVQAASAVINAQPERRPVALQAVRPPGKALRLLTVPGELAEGIAVVQQINHMVGGADMMQADQHAGYTRGTRSFNDFGVLVRTGQQTDILEQCFLQEGLPYCLIGQTSFLEKPAVRQVLALLRYLCQPENPLRLLQALEAEPFRPATSALGKLREQLRMHPTATALPDLAVAVPGAASRLQKLAATVEHYRPFLTEPPQVLLQHWQEDQSLTEEADLMRLQRVAERTTTLPQLFELLALGKEADYQYTSARGPVPVEAVKIMTLHAAKGLEFAVVFLCGVEDGLLPVHHQDSQHDEERRLFYVGLTRARDELILTQARTRQRHGKRQPSVPSPFLADIPVSLLQEEKVEVPRSIQQTSQLSLFS